MAKFVPVKTIEEAQTAYDSGLLYWHVPLWIVHNSPVKTHGLANSLYYCKTEAWGILVEEEDES